MPGILGIFLLLCQILVVAGDCPFEGGDACKRWEANVRMTKLENSVDYLVKQVGVLNDENVKVNSELAITRDLLSKCVDKLPSSWHLKRMEMTLPKMTKLAFHQVTPTIVEKFPLPLPENTRAIIVSLFVHFWNSNGHAYLGGTLQQVGNEADGATKFFHQHYNVYANTWHEEFFVPWNPTDANNELQLKVTSSYQTGGDKNWFTFAVVGYVTA